jgi:hypothetical protein
VVEGLVGGKSRGDGDWHEFTPKELFWLIDLRARPYDSMLCGTVHQYKRSFPLPGVS